MCSPSHAAPSQVPQYRFVSLIRRNTPSQIRQGTHAPFSIFSLSVHSSLNGDRLTLIYDHRPFLIRNMHDPDPVSGSQAAETVITCCPSFCLSVVNVMAGGFTVTCEPFAKFVVEHVILLANVMCHS